MRICNAKETFYQTVKHLHHRVINLNITNFLRYNPSVNFKNLIMNPRHIIDYYGAQAHIIYPIHKSYNIIVVKEKR